MNNNCGTGNGSCCQNCSGCGGQKLSISELGWCGFLKKLYGRYKPSGGALILRLVLGILMVAAGWWKVTHMESVLGFFASGGFTHFEAYLVSWVELIGGILLIIGLWNKPVCVAFAIQMAVIVWGTPASDSVIYFGHDYGFVLLGCFLALYVMGPGKYSVGYLLSKRGCCSGKTN